MTIAGKYNTNHFVGSHFVVFLDKALFFWEITGGLIPVLNTKSITRKKAPLCCAIML